MVNKKLLFLLIALILVGVFYFIFYSDGSSTGAVISKCADTDGGVNIYGKGSATSVGNSRIYIKDECNGLTGVVEAYCTSESGVATSKEEVCPIGYHCNDAACIETVECNDGVDNNGNGLKDYPNDPRCSSLTDESEG